jgi:hypothetical protein
MKEQDCDGPVGGSDILISWNNDVYLLNRSVSWFVAVLITDASCVSVLMTDTLHVWDVPGLISLLSMGCLITYSVGRRWRRQVSLHASTLSFLTSVFWCHFQGDGASNSFGDNCSLARLHSVPIWLRLFRRKSHRLLSVLECLPMPPVVGRWRWKVR